MKGVSAEARLFEYARKHLGMSQRRLALRLGMNQSSISKIESGVHRPRVNTIRKLELLTGKRAELLACEALGLPVPKPVREVSTTEKQQEARVIKLNPRYRQMDTKELEYLKCKFSSDAVDLKVKAHRDTYQLKGKILKTRLHKITLEHLQLKYKEVSSLHDFLLKKGAPTKMLETTQTRLNTAALQLKKQKSYGIHLHTIAELMLEELKIDTLLAKSRKRSQYAAQIEFILETRKQQSVPATLPLARLASFPTQRYVVMSI